MNAVVLLTFTTRVSGKTLTECIRARGRDLDWTIRVYDKYGWHLIGYEYLSL